MSELNEKTPLLEVRNLRKLFPGKSSFMKKDKAWIKAVDGVSFKLDAKETLGVVGESGCGKSTMGRSVLRLIEPTEGEILYKGKDFTKASGQELRKMRADMQIIFQDPYASLNPRMTVGEIIAEPLNIQKRYKTKEETRAHVPLRYNNDKQKKPLFSRGLSVCRLLFNSFSKLKIDENYKEKRRLFY